MEFVQNFLNIERWVAFFNALALPIISLSDFFINDVPTLVSWINPTNLLPNLVTAISSGLSDLGVSLGTFLTDTFNDVTSALNSFVFDLSADLSELWTGFVDSLTVTLNDWASGISNIWNDFLGWLGVNNG